MPSSHPPSAARRALLATLVGLTFVSAVRTPAQTATEPLTSRLQILGASTGSQEFLVDAGVTRASVDVRQKALGDACAVSAPLGQALSAAATQIETLAVKADMSQVDVLGLYSDRVAFTPLQAGAYSVSSAQPFIALVEFEGGGLLEFWLEPFDASGTIPTGQAFAVRARLSDAAGQPVTGASVSATLQQTTKPGGEFSEKPYRNVLALLPTAEPGIYSATQPGLTQGGAYTFSVQAEKDLLRRHLVASLAVIKTPLAAYAAPASNTPLNFTQIYDVASAEAAATNGPGSVLYYPEDRADPFKPVIVYVHGFNDSPSVWFGGNGFTGSSLDANYRVAVVQVHPDKSFGTNAGLLAAALPQIAAHYDVRKMVVVAHSKGGVDMDAALLGAGMTDYVKSMITLATPHWGTPLADLADSDWVSWLADILGQRNDAQRSMKPGSMAAYRAQVASHPRNNFGYLDIRTFCGWKYWNDPLAYYVLSGPYLANHGGGSGNGGNDGVVNYRDALRPVSTEIFSGRPDSRTGYNHREITRRSKYWGHIQAQLLTMEWDNAPSAPGNVTATLVDTPELRAVRLDWLDRSRHETAFIVERAVDGGAFGELGRIDAQNAFMYHDFAVSPGHTYAYRVRTTLAERWYSDWSNTAAVEFPSPVPAAPSGLSASALSPTSARLTWSDNSTNESGFEVYRRPSGSSSFTRIATTLPDVTSFSDGTLAAASAYDFRVRAVNGSFVSGYSNVASVTTPQITLGAPSGLTASYHAASATIRLAWVDGSSQEAGFQVQFSYSGSAFADMSPATVGANVTTYTSGPNPPFGPYQFRVRAFAGAASSNWSNTASLLVQAGAPEARLIQAWDGVAIADGASFTFPATPVAGLPISRLFKLCNDGTAPLDIVNPTGLVSGTGFTQIDVAPVTPVQPGACSQFRVRFHVAGAGLFSGAITLQNNDADENPYNVTLLGTATP